MPDYKYQGTSRSGASVSGVMTAGSKSELSNLLKRQQITATKMTEKGKEFNIPTFGGGVNAKELAIFTRQFKGRNVEFLPDRKNTRLNSSHLVISYAVFCLKKKKNNKKRNDTK